MLLSSDGRMANNEAYGSRATGQKPEAMGWKVCSVDLQPAEHKNIITLDVSFWECQSSNREGCKRVGGSERVEALMLWVEVLLLNKVTTTCRCRGPARACIQTVWGRCQRQPRRTWPDWPISMGCTCLTASADKLRRYLRKGSLDILASQASLQQFNSELELNVMHAVQNWFRIRILSTSSQPLVQSLFPTVPTDLFLDMARSFQIGLITRPWPHQQHASCPLFGCPLVSPTMPDLCKVYKPFPVSRTTVRVYGLPSISPRLQRPATAPANHSSVFSYFHAASRWYIVRHHHRQICLFHSMSLIAC